MPEKPAPSSPELSLIERLMLGMPQTSHQAAGPASEPPSEPPTAVARKVTDRSEQYRARVRPLDRWLVAAAQARAKPGPDIA